MNRRLLIVPEKPGPRLRAIEEPDLEALRIWKNRDRSSFFFKGIIEPEQQARWYAGFCARPDDFMFMVEAPRTPAPQAFGCMGFRLVGNVVDVYNVIRGVELRGRDTRMGDALVLMCSYAMTFARDITLRVLRDNPAVGWYERFFFVRVEEHPDHYFMRLDAGRFVPVRYRLEASA
jgi:ribosomal protein S18 acetylase RimI-like enzyme